MFNNIGEKIKAIASLFCIIGIILSLIIGICMIAIGAESYNDGLTIIGLFIMIAGCLISWIGSFVLYGYGQLIDNTDRILHQSMRLTQLMPDNKNQLNEKKKEKKYIPDKKINLSNNDNSIKWKCINCGRMISEDICPYCGNDISKYNFMKNPITTKQEPEEEQDQQKKEWKCSNCGRTITEDICPYCSDKI